MKSPTGIDPDTGLARLPDGYYWEVKEGTYLDDPIFYLNIVGYGTEVITHYPLFRKPYTTEKQVPVSIHSGYVWAYEIHGDDYYSSGFANYLTPECLLLSSARELERYFENNKENDKRLEHLEESKKLLGNYPPNSIN